MSAKQSATRRIAPAFLRFVQRSTGASDVQPLLAPVLSMLKPVYEHLQRHYGNPDKQVYHFPVFL